MTINIHCLLYFAHFFLGREMLQATVAETIETHFSCSVTFLKNRAFDKIRWKNTVHPDRPQMTRQCMRIACWITKATNTHSEYVIIIVFPLLQWLQQSPSMLRCTYNKCLVNLDIRWREWSVSRAGRFTLGLTACVIHV
jgi:hypothetical protein